MHSTVTIKHTVRETVDMNTGSIASGLHFGTIYLSADYYQYQFSFINQSPCQHHRYRGVRCKCRPPAHVCIPFLQYILRVQPTDRPLRSHAVWYSETSPDNHLRIRGTPHNYTSHAHLPTSFPSNSVSKVTSVDHFARPFFSGPKHTSDTQMS